MNWFKRKQHPEFWQDYIVHFKGNQQNDLKQYSVYCF